MSIQYISIILTGIFGISGILLTIFILNKPRLKCYQIFPGKLFSENVNDISKLEIRYNTEKIVGELIFLQILINNEGNSDIDSNSIYEPLKITYKEPLKVLDAFINSKFVNIDFNFSDNSLYLKWDLLKKNEYFIINIILKYCEEDKLKINNRNILKNYTEIGSRIKNIYQIKKETYTKIITNRDKISFAIILFCLFITTLSMGIITINLNNVNRERELLYDNIKERSKELLEVGKQLVKINGYYIDLVDFIITPKHIENLDIVSEVEKKLDIIIQETRKIVFAEDDIDVNKYEMPISINDFDENVISYFIFSLLLFLADIYITVNYFKTRRIANYLK